MDFEIQEVNEVPRTHCRKVYEYKYNPIIEAAMASKTGIVSVKLESIEEARKVAAAVHTYLKSMELQDLFQVNQRRCVVFVTDHSRQGARPKE